MQAVVKYVLPLLTAFSLGAQEPVDLYYEATEWTPPLNNLDLNPVYIEARAALFFPLGHRFRQIYSNVEALWGAEISYELNDCFQTWFGVSYLSDRGRSHNLEYRTSLQFLPITCGLKYLYPCSWAKFYVGGGFQYTYMHNHDQSPYAIHHINHWDWGLIGKAGMLIPINDCVYFDAFTEYSYLMMSFRKTKDGMVYRHRPNLCSINIGLGLGYKL